MSVGVKGALSADAEWVERPFARVPFDQLPATPRRPHPFLGLPRRDVVVRLPEGPLRLRVTDVAPAASAPSPATRATRRKRPVGGSSPVPGPLESTGDDPPALLLVHGLMTSSYSFRYVVGPLVDAGFRVIVPDLPGAGESDAPARCDVGTLAASMRALLDTLGLERAAVIGNSMGGYVMMQLALDAPERVTTLVQVHGPAFPLPRLRALALAFRAPGSRALLARLVARDPERWVHRNVHYFDETLKSREEAQIYGAPLRTDEGRRAFVSWMADGLDPDDLSRFAARLRALDGSFPVPLQLLYARTDPMVPPEVGRRLGALLPGAEQVWLEGSSHFAHVDTPRAFLAAVLPFLARTH